MDRKKIAALFVAAAAIIWALDSTLRFQGLESVNPFALVFFEHLFGMLLLLPFLAKREIRRDLSKVTVPQMGAILVLGLGGAVLGGVFFAESLIRLGPSTTTIFQMLQPLVVLGLASLVLREKHSGAFLSWAMWVMIAAALMCGPDFSFGFKVAEDAGAGIAFGLIAVLCWGASTVAGKWLLRYHTPLSVVFYRWITAVIGLGAFMVARHINFDLPIFYDWKMVAKLLTLGSLLGILPMWLYYRGLKVLPASVVTFIELLYPLFGTLLPALFYGKSMNGLQWLGGIFIFAGVFFLLRMEFELGLSPNKRRS